MPFVTVNGVKLNYEIKGHGSPILLIHGLGSSLLDWENQIDFLSKHYQVIAFDLRGHGQSDKPDRPYSIHLFTQDTVKLLEALAITKVHLIGHSLGGMIAFQLALDHPNLVERLCVINSAPAVILSLKEQVFFLTRITMVKLFGMEKLSISLANMLFPKSEQKNLREVFIKRWGSNDPTAYLNTMSAFKNYNLLARLPQIQSPTLILSAANDYTSTTFKAFYTKLIPNARLIVIDDSWHMSIVDKPLIVNKAIENFLTKKD